MRIASNQTNPIRPIGSAITLTCMADLDPAIDVPGLVTVNIQLSDPAGRTLTTTTQSVSGFTYTIIATISSFGREQSGTYTCRVSIGSSRSWSITEKVTVGKTFSIIIAKLNLQQLLKQHGCVAICSCNNIIMCTVYASFILTPRNSTNMSIL
jgi:hypothetical protein